MHVYAKRFLELVEAPSMKPIAPDMELADGRPIFYPLHVTLQWAGEAGPSAERQRSW